MVDRDCLGPGLIASCEGIAAESARAMANLQFGRMGGRRHTWRGDF
jgi:hypothetical protein